MKSAERRITLTLNSAQIIKQHQKPTENMAQTIERILNLNPFLNLIPLENECFED